MSVELSVHVLRAGSCRHPARMVDRARGWETIVTPSLCALVGHPSRGWSLYDTGYAHRFFAATQAFPQRLYRAALPVEMPECDDLVAQLAHLGVAPQDVSTIVVSHYHADHVCGLRDFPNARFVASQADTAALRAHRSAWSATLRGHLPALLPEDFDQRVRGVETFGAVALPAWMAPFALGFDLFADGSALAVPLPGHSLGQIGLLVPNAGGRPVFLAGDACWSMAACRAGRLPSPLVSFVNADDRAYRLTYARLGQLALREPSLAVLPAHCSESWNAFNQR